MSAVAPGKRRSNDAYNSKCDYIAVKPMLPVGLDIRRAAQEAGESIQGYILQAIRDRMYADGFRISSPNWPCSPSGRVMAPHEDHPDE